MNKLCKSIASGFTTIVELVCVSSLSSYKCLVLDRHWVIRCITQESFPPIRHLKYEFNHLTIETNLSRANTTPDDNKVELTIFKQDKERERPLNLWDRQGSAEIFPRSFVKLSSKCLPKSSGDLWYYHSLGSRAWFMITWQPAWLLRGDKTIVTISWPHTKVTMAFRDATRSFLSYRQVML
jgi:hypothetical protein